MAYSEQSDEMYTYFTQEEDELIEKWLKDHGYTWGHNTVCGNCCGMYEDEYWVNGVTGRFDEKDREAFVEFANHNNIGCSVEGNSITALDQDA